MDQKPTDRRFPQLDMTPDGQFRTPAAPPVSGQILRIALIVAGVATAGAFAFLALWVAMTLIPIALGAGLVAYGLIRYRMWKAGVSFGRPGGRAFRSAGGFPPNRPPFAR